MRPGSRNLRIVVADDGAEFLRRLELEKNGLLALGDIPHSIIPHCIGRDFSIEQTVEALLEKRADMYVIDYNLSRPFNGQHVIDQCSPRRNVPYLLISDGRLPSNVQNHAGVWARKRGVGGFMGFASLMRKNTIKPLNIGVYGTGDLGRKLILSMIRSPEVARVGVWSTRLESQPRMRELIYSLFEEEPDHSKLHVEDLEDLAEESDILLVASSQLRGREVVQRSMRYGRNSVFPFEHERNTQFCRRIQEAGYTGFLVYTSNPIGLLQEQARREGVDPGIIMTPLQPTSTRMIRSLRNKFPEDKYGSLYREIWRYISGVHGEPRIVRAPTLLPSPHGFFSKSQKKKLKSAEESARKMAYESQQAVRAFGQGAYFPPESIARALLPLARYEQMGCTSQVYNTFKRRGKTYEGFVALPTHIDWIQWRVSSEIPHDDRDYFNTAALHFLRVQQKILAENGLI